MSEILSSDQLEFELNEFILINYFKFKSNTFKISYDVAHESIMITIVKGDEN